MKAYLIHHHHVETTQLLQDGFLKRDVKRESIRDQLFIAGLDVDAPDEL